MASAFTPVENLPGQFDILKRALIDSSSIIYLDKIGQYHKLCKILDLVTIPEVLEECGKELSVTNLEVVVFECRAMDSTDERLLAGASRLRLPVISDDRNILKKVASRGLSYFNTLMMVYFLFYKGEIDTNSTRKLVGKLRKFAFYQQHIWDYGQSVHTYIENIKSNS